MRGGVEKKTTQFRERDRRRSDAQNVSRRLPFPCGLPRTP